MRAHIALVLLAVGVGVGIALVMRGGVCEAGVGVAPAPAPKEVPRPPEIDASVPGLREPIAVPIEAPLAVESTAPSPEVVAPQVAVAFPEDLSKLNDVELAYLDTALTKEIDALTREEFAARLRNGLGELVGTDGSLRMQDYTWDPDVLMVLRCLQDGTWWKVELPREEYPRAYALADRRRAVRTARGLD